jgi:hypothetical protein
VTDPAAGRSLLGDPADTPLARLAGSLGPPGDGPRPPGTRTWPWVPDVVWVEALRGAATTTERWRLWRDGSFWTREVEATPERTTLEQLDLAGHLLPELRWFYMQPGAKMAAPLRALLDGWRPLRPLRDAEELGRDAAAAGDPPRRLLQRWGAGPGAPAFMADALAEYAAELCDRVGSGLTESQVDRQLAEALRGEERFQPRWLHPVIEEPPPEGLTAIALKRAVPEASWPALRETRKILEEWLFTRKERLGTDGRAALEGLFRYSTSDLLMRFAEELAGKPYDYLNELWSRGQGSSESPVQRNIRVILARVGMFMNYAGSIRDIIIVVGAGRGTAVEQTALAAGRVIRAKSGVDYVVLLFDRVEFLVPLHTDGCTYVRVFPLAKARGDLQPGDPPPTSQKKLDIALWERRLSAIANHRTAEGEQATQELLLVKNGWQPRLIASLARHGIHIDEGIHQIRGIPARYQRETWEAIRGNGERT